MEQVVVVPFEALNAGLTDEEFLDMLEAATEDAEELARLDMRARWMEDLHNAHRQDLLNENYEDELEAYEERKRRRIAESREY